MHLTAIPSSRSCGNGLTRKIVRVMKLTAVLLFAACMQVAARTEGQTVTLKVTNAPMKEVFREIQKQTGLNVMVDEAILEKAGRVTLDVRDMPVSQVLNICLKNEPLTYTIVDGRIVVKPTLTVALQPTVTPPVLNPPPPPIDVKGRVVNENGEPMAGASVQVKGDKTKGTSTDANGYFELKGIDENATLVISGVNIESYEVKVNGRSDLATLTVKNKTISGEEVTVEANTGYQKVKPNEITGSLVVVDNKTLNQQTGTNILERLRGVTSSLLFDTKNRSGFGGTKESIIIRGLGTINGSTDPLIVVDNFPYQGDINNINPNDVENITILKDAAAISIWGAKGANGVIVITTKKGKFNQPLKFELNSNIIVSEEPDLFSLPQMSSSEYINVEEYLFNKNFFNSRINSPAKVALPPAIEILIQRRSGQISAIDSAKLIDDLKSSDIRDEYNKYFYRKSVNQQYALSLKGGSSSNAYRISGGYDKNIGFTDQKSERVNILIQNSYKPIKNLLVSFAAMYTQRKNISGKPSYGTITVSGRPVTYLKFADNNGNPLPVANLLREGYTDTAGGGKLLNWKYYPIEEYKFNRTTSKLQDITASINLEYQVLKSLNASINYQYQKQNLESDNLQDINSFAARNVINRFTQLNRSTGQINYIVPLGGILNQSFAKIESQNIRGQLKFDKVYNNHSISAITGLELTEIDNYSGNLSVYGYSEDPLTTGLVDYSKSYPSFINGAAQTIGGSPTYSKKLTRLVSAYGNASYSYKDKYIVSGSFRKDASNVFGLNTNDKWNPLWSSGIGWNISNENFYKFSLLPTLKFRVTYGFSGNLDLSKSAATVMQYNSTTDYFTNLPYGYITQYQNDELRWEKIGTINFGIDFSSKKQILSGSVEYYRKKGIDLFGPSPIDYTVGQQTSVITRNVANMVGNGIDVSLNSKNLSGSFKWFSSFILNYYIDKVTKYYREPGGLYGPTFSTSISPLVGKPVYSVISYKWGGLDPTNGNPRGYLDGHESTNYNSIRQSLTSIDSLVYSGPATPKFFGAIANTFSWKGLSATINFTYKLGYYFRKNSIDYASLFNNGLGHSDFSRRWQKPGDENITNVPSLIFPNIAGRDAFYLLSEATVMKADHIRLQYINFSYDLINSFSRTIFLQSMQFYFNLSNLGIIWRANNENLDPDYSYSNLVPPPSKNFTVGFRANF